MALPLRSSLARSRYGCSTLGPRLDPTTASARVSTPAYSGAKISTTRLCNTWISTGTTRPPAFTTLERPAGRGHQLPGLPGPAVREPHRVISFTLTRRHEADKVRSLHAMRLALLQPRMMASISDVEMRGPCGVLLHV